VGRGHKGNGTTALVLRDGERTPLGVLITAANESEVHHIERLLKTCVVPLPEQTRLLYDGAADSDPLRARLAARGVELICPHRSNRVKPATQDGRKLRRRRHRWKIERTNAWLQSYGRIAIRKDRLGMMFLGWAQLACLLTILKRF
jgi:transposase